LGKYIIAGSSLLIVIAILYSYFFIPYPDSKYLPLYALFSLGRISIVFLISLAFGIVVGVFSAVNKAAGKIITPIFDILQSVPILGYFPILLVAIIAAIPGYFGRELAVWVLLFTAMEWSIFFGVVGAIRAIPPSVKEAASTFNIRGYAYFRNVIVPAIVPALISASTLAWNDGWTFDIAAEFVSYNGQDYSVRGIGSFIANSSLVNQNLEAAWTGLLLVGGIVILTNQVIWHRLADTVSTRKPIFSVHIPERVVHPLRVVRMPARRIFGLRFRVEFLGLSRFKNSFPTRIVAISFLATLAALGIASNLSSIVPSFYVISQTMKEVDPFQTVLFTLFTLGRLFVVYIAALFVSLTAAALASSGSKTFRKFFYTIYDIGRAIPYLALFPPLFATLVQVIPGESGLEISSFFLIFMGMIWYIIYNVVVAASYLPQELNELSSIFGFKGLRRLRDIIIPSVLPAIVTGSILAWGGGWNVIIYSEYITQGNKVYSLPGLGFLLNQAANEGNSSLVIFYLFIMSGIVILIGRIVWRRLIERVERRGLELI
jgi:NitT/TauT family transport system permease protein